MPYIRVERLPCSALAYRLVYSVVCAGGQWGLVQMTRDSKQLRTARRAGRPCAARRAWRCPAVSTVGLAGRQPWAVEHGQ